MEDLFAVLVLIGIVMFAIIRFTHNPAKLGRKSRFFGSHTKGAWIVLLMIFLVVVTLLATAVRRSATSPTSSSTRRHERRLRLHSSVGLMVPLTEDATRGSRRCHLGARSPSSWSSC